jgi:hypothetical protein
MNSKTIARFHAQLGSRLVATNRRLFEHVTSVHRFGAEYLVALVCQVTKIQRVDGKLHEDPSFPARAKTLSAVQAVTQLKSLMAVYDRPALNPDCQITDVAREAAAQKQLDQIIVLLGKAL